MSRRGSSWQRALRATVGLAIASSALVATAADAAPRCAAQRHEVDTLDLAVTAGAAVRGRDLVVEVTVTRGGTARSPVVVVGDADVSIRLRTPGGIAFAGGTSDSQGRTRLLVPVDARTPVGKAVVAAEAWLEQTPRVWCVPSVHEHGYAEISAQVTAR